jgi:hypothetical protein
MTPVRRLILLPLAVTLIGGLVAACGLDLPFTSIKACNGSAQQARVGVQLGFTKEEAVLAPGECTTAVTSASDPDKRVAYNVVASGGASYVAKIQERRQAVLDQQMAGGGDVEKLWKDLSALNLELASVGTDTAGTACGGRIGEGSFASVTISVAGDKWNCGGVVIVTPEPATPKATS